MEWLLTGGRVVDPASGLDAIADVHIRAGKIAGIRVVPRGEPTHVPQGTEEFQVMDVSGLVVAPGLVDLHVHLREPGQTHKEDIASGTRAAARGGVTTVLAMPNTVPVIDTPERVRGVLASADQTAAVRVCQVGAVTKGQRGERLTDFAALKEAGVTALSDDGHPVASDALMEEAMRQAQEQGLLLIDHCEPETAQVKRDIELARQTGCPIHLAHLSRVASLSAVRAAKREGLPVTAETCPHYFFFTERATERMGAKAKMNPPLGAELDRRAVIEAVCDGTLDIITTDHAPHHESEKTLPFAQAPNGIVGLETLLSAGLTAFVHTGLLTLPQLLARMTVRPAEILGASCGRLEEGAPADLIVFDPDGVAPVRVEDFASKGRYTPFEGMALRGMVKTVFVSGKEVVSQGRLVV